MSVEQPAFDFRSFYKALATTVAAQNLTWKGVSEQTGVSQTTLSRMGRGRQPDAESLTRLSAWSGLNPVEYFTGPRRAPHSLALVGKLLRDDPGLDEAAVDTLEAMLKAAYQTLRRDPA